MSLLKTNTVITPTFNRVLLLMDESTVRDKVGKIIIPEEARDDSAIGDVVGTGQEVEEIQTGMRVYIGKWNNYL